MAQGPIYKMYNLLLSVDPYILRLRKIWIMNAANKNSGSQAAARSTAHAWIRAPPTKPPGAIISDVPSPANEPATEDIPHLLSGKCVFGIFLAFNLLSWCVYFNTHVLNVENALLHIVRGRSNGRTWSTRSLVKLLRSKLEDGQGSLHFEIHSSDTIPAFKRV